MNKNTVPERGPLSLSPLIRCYLAPLTLSCTANKKLEKFQRQKGAHFEASVCPFKSVRRCFVCEWSPPPLHERNFKRFFSSFLVQGMTCSECGTSTSPLPHQPAITVKTIIFLNPTYCTVYVYLKN